MTDNSATGSPDSGVETPSHQELPIPDYDHLPLGSLLHRIRALDSVGLEQLLAYESAHAHRLPVVQALEHRRDELRSGAQPSGGDPAAAQPEHPGARGGSSVGGSQTAGLEQHPPFEGVPGEPRRPHSGRSPESK